MFFRDPGGLSVRFPIGERRRVSGKLAFFGDAVTITHPTRVATLEEELPACDPVYPVVEGLSQRAIHKAIVSALAAVKEELTANAPDLLAAFAVLYWPSSLAAVRPDDLARTHLAYQELLAGQLAAALRRAARVRIGPLVFSGYLKAATVDTLPFRPTDWQVKASAEITCDLRSGPAHATYPAGRRRQRQDPRCPTRGPGYRGSGKANRLDGADRNPSDAALRNDPGAFARDTDRPANRLDVGL